MQKTLNSSLSSQQPKQENPITSEYPSAQSLILEEIGPKSIEWAAGIYEGEGSTYRVLPDDDRYWALAVKMTDLDVLQYFRNTFELGSVRGPYFEKSKLKKGIKCKPFYKYQVARRKDVATVLQLILPHLCQRRAEHALKVLNEITN